jgi:hypothetical protein
MDACIMTLAMLVPSHIICRNLYCTNAPDGGEPYWLMMVVIPTHIVLETFTDPDVNTYLPGDVVFSGY